MPSGTYSTQHLSFQKFAIELGGLYQHYQPQTGCRFVSSEFCNRLNRGRYCQYFWIYHCLGFGAVAFLMSYLVPQMASFLRNMGQELPLNTKFLIALSNAFVGYWWLFIGVPILMAIALAAIIKANPVARYRFDRIKLNLPVTGPIMQKIIMARFARYFALMYQTGIPILDAIKICERIVGNRVVADALSRAHAQISAGDSMSESFRNAGLFPHLVVRMIKVGESTGALDKSLLNISYFYDRDVNESMQKLLKLIEPALTVFLGLILGFIMYSVLGPVYDSFSKLKI